MVTLLSCIVVLGVASQWLAWRLGLPSILVLLAVGLLVGPMAREFTPMLFGRSLSVDPAALMSDRVLLEAISLAVGVILFEGGLTLSLREITGVQRVVGMLVTVGAAATWVMASAAAHYILALEWPLALIFGAVLIVTGPTVIGPLLRFVRPTGRAGSVLRWEGIVIDPIGAMAAVLVFEAVLSGLTPGHGMIWSMARSALLIMAAGATVGGAAAWLLVAALRRYAIPDHLHVPVTLAAVILAFLGSNQLVPESGLFTTTVMGIVMANQRQAAIRHILEFKEVVTTLMIGMLFIVLSARMELSRLMVLGPAMLLFLAVLIVIIRPVSVLLSTMFSRLKLKERLFIGWLAPRGIVAASVASVFALRLQQESPAYAAQARLLLPYTFAVVVCTVAVYGLTAARIARRLGLASGRQSGFLIIGGDVFGRELAHALVQEGIDVLLVDTNLENIRDARLQGIPVLAANALSAQVAERISLSPIGRLLALTSNHEVNSLACLQYARIFGRNNVYQLAERRRSAPGLVAEDVDRELVGRTLFADDADAELIQWWMEEGAHIHKTRLTDAFDLAKYREQHAGRALPLLAVSAGGIVPLTAGEPVRVARGEQIIGLVLPGEVASAPRPGSEERPASVPPGA